MYYMCETLDCKELLNPILNVYMPQILQPLDNYVVKGGRASDYYIDKTSGIPFTDWDIVCTSKVVQKTIRSQIIEVLKKEGFNNIKEETIVTNDNKSGIQLGVYCKGEPCFFTDIVLYPPDDPIFINNEISEQGIKYINIDYLLDDLTQTYRDRIHNLKEWLDEIHIVNVNPSELTYDNIDSILDSIKQTHIALLKVQLDKSIALLDDDDTDYELTQEEKDEDKKEITDKYKNDINEIDTVTIPELRARFEKLIRTKERFNKLKRESGGKKRKRRTIKLRKTAKIRKRTRRYKHLK
jgi:hypothetical protein